MGCGCHSEKSIKAREKRKREKKLGQDRTKLHMKRKTCYHCEHMKDNKCGLSKNKKTTMDTILKNKKYKCPKGLF